MRKRALLGVAVCALALAGLSAGPALAGEVKGPPGDGTVLLEGGNPNKTGALLHAHSICASSGLNDFDSEEGQNSFHVQSYGIDVSGKGDPADPHQFNPGDVCQGRP
jgi:hypothetical protein